MSTRETVWMILAGAFIIAICSVIIAAAEVYA